MSTEETKKRKHRASSEEEILNEIKKEKKNLDVEDILKSTTVCNVKVNNLRPGYSNLKEWSENRKNLYIGRPGVVFIDKQRFPKVGSVWANPFKVGKDGKLPQVMKKFEEYIKKKIHDDPKTFDLESLSGLNLGCWCVPSTVTVTSNCPMVCHGQILIQLLKEHLEESDRKQVTVDEIK